MFTLEYSPVVRFPAARARPAQGADPARRHVQPFPLAALRRVGGLGSLQRHRGCRSRRPAGAGGLHGRRHQLDHLRGSQRRPAELDPAAHRAGSRAICRPGWCICATRSQLCEIDRRRRAFSPSTSSSARRPFTDAAQRRSSGRSRSWRLVTNSLDLRLAVPRAVRHHGGVQPGRRQPVPRLFRRRRGAEAPLFRPRAGRRHCCRSTGCCTRSPPTRRSGS